MKKKFLLILSIVCVIIFTACSNKNNINDTNIISELDDIDCCELPPVNDEIYDMSTLSPTKIITPTEEISFNEEITKILTEEPTIKPTKETPEITDEITPEIIIELTEEPTLENTEEVILKPTEDIIPEPITEPVEVQTYSYNGLEFEFPAKDNKYFEKLLAVDLTNHDYDGTYIGFYDDGARAIVYMNNSNDEVYYDFGGFEEESSLEKKDPKKWAEYSEDWYQEYLLFINGDKMAVDLNNDEYISDIELYICIDFSLGMKKSMKGVGTY